MKCRNCEYWDNYNHDFSTDHTCKSPKMISVDGNSSYTISNDELAVTYEDATVTTGPDFGCIHFLAKS